MPSLICWRVEDHSLKEATKYTGTYEMNSRIGGSCSTYFCDYIEAMEAVADCLGRDVGIAVKLDDRYLDLSAPEAMKVAFGTSFDCSSELFDMPELKEYIYEY